MHQNTEGFTMMMGQAGNLLSFSFSPILAVTFCPLGIMVVDFPQGKSGKATNFTNLKQTEQ